MRPEAEGQSGELVLVHGPPKVAMSVVSITSDAMKRVVFIHLLPPSLLIRSSLNRKPLTLKYREEGKMQAGASAHGGNRIDMP